MILRLLLLVLLVTSASAQTTEITPNENLVAEGIPKISASIVAQTAPYTKGRHARDSSG